MHYLEGDFIINSNFLRICEESDPGVFAEAILKIHQIKNTTFANTKILLIYDRGPLFGTKFINSILIMYAHILELEIHVYCMASSVVHNAPHGRESSDLRLEKILGTKLNIKFYYGDNELPNTFFDKIFINIGQEVYDEEMTRMIGKLAYEKAYFFFYYVDQHKALTSGIFKLLKGGRLITRHQKKDWYFSRMIVSLYTDNIGFRDKRYDIVIAGSPRGRDYNLLEEICDMIPGITCLVIVGKQEDKVVIQKKISVKNTIAIVQNNNSYSDFIQHIKQARIFLNCPPKNAKYGYGSTGALLAFGSKMLILSRKTRFYKKYIKEGETGFFYKSNVGCIRKLKYILQLKDDEIEKIRLKKQRDFMESHHIEDDLLEIFTL